MKSTIFSKKSLSGFTLMETVIAIGIVGVLLTTFLAAFGPAATTIRKSINTQTAERLATALETEMGLLRDGERGPTGTTYDLAFEKALDMIKNGNKAEGALIAYEYKAELTTSPLSGGKRPQPVSVNATGLVIGQDYQLTPAVRFLGDSDSQLTQELEVVQGRVYCIQLSQLYSSAEGLKVNTDLSADAGSPNKITGSTSADNFPEAHIMCVASFYELPTSSPQYFEGGNSSAALEYIRREKLFPEGSQVPDKKPLFTRNFSVRR